MCPRGLGDKRGEARTRVRAPAFALFRGCPRVAQRLPKVLMLGGGPGKLAITFRGYAG